MSFSEREIEIVIEIHSHINSNFKKRIPIADFVTWYNISESTLSRRFKLFYKKSIYQYRLELCMQYAMQLLQQGEQIKAIKIELGYSHKSKFNNHFKKVHGSNPSKFIPVKDLKVD